MPVVSLTGNDTVIINNRVFTDFADADIAKLTYPIEIADLKVGKNGNAIYALNENGRQCDVELRLVRATPDDVYLNNLLLTQKANFAGFVLMIGQFIKLVGDGAGNISNDTYIMSGGIFVSPVEVTSNVEGDTSQSVAIWKLKFSNSPRAIG
jgi:hypothetical protein